MSTVDSAEDRAVEALRWAVQHPDSENGVNLRDAVARIAEYVLARAEEAEREKGRAAPAPTPEPTGPVTAEMVGAMQKALRVQFPGVNPSPAVARSILVSALASAPRPTGPVTAEMVRDAVEIEEVGG